MKKHMKTSTHLSLTFGFAMIAFMLPVQAVLVHYRVQPGDALPYQQWNWPGRPFIAARADEES